MMIKVNDEYLEFNGDIVIEKQLFKFDTLETAGTFSYSFTIPDTSYNRKILGILNINSNEEISLVENVSITTNSGIVLYKGYILIDDPLNIECSFFSDNNNFFASIKGNVSDVICLEQYDTELNEDNIVNSWTASSGIVFPLVDRGGLYLRKDAFMKLRIRVGRRDQNDWQPFIFVKDVVKCILQNSGLKISGDLISDTNYINLITTNSSPAITNKKIKMQEFYVGTETVQTIPNGSANAVKINFDLTDSPFYNSQLGNFSVSNSRWTLTYDTRSTLTFNGLLSDDTHQVTWEFRRNNVNIFSVFTNGNTVVGFNSDTAFKNYDQPGDYLELWAYVDPSTAGSVDLISGNFSAEVFTTNTIFAQSLIPSMSSRQFISNVFKLFNVIADYDPFSKTIITRLVKNIKQSEEQDLSDYLHRVVSIRNTELISEYAQSNILKYGELDSDVVDKYNQDNEIPFGGGELTINNSTLEDVNDLIELDFKAPYVYRNDAFGLYLIRLDFVNYGVPDTVNDPEDVTSVTNSGGLAQFNSALGGVKFHNNYFIEDATGTFTIISGGDDGIQGNSNDFKEADGDNQIIALNFKATSLPKSFRFTGLFDASLTGLWPIYRLENMTNPNYNGDWERNDFPSAVRTSASVAVFAKAQNGSELDSMRQGLSFGEIQGTDSLTLKETYYSDLQKILNDPVKPIVEMLLPENVFNSLSFLSPVRIRSEKVNGSFLVNKLTGYSDSVTPCTFELIKLSV